MRGNFYTDQKIVAGQTSPEDALSAGNYPASGSYVDVTGYEWVNIVVHLGAIHASDTPTFEVKQADSLTGTLDAIDTTNAKAIMANDDDDQFVTFYLETANLADDHHFLSVAVSGVTNGSYGDIVYFLGGARTVPVTQSVTITADTFAG